MNYTVPFSNTQYGVALSTVPVDPNSIEALKGNIQLAKQQLERIQALTSNAISGL
jgi:hypothetical protein